MVVEICLRAEPVLADDRPCPLDVDSLICVVERVLEHVVAVGDQSADYGRRQGYPARRRRLLTPHRRSPPPLPSAAERGEPRHAASSPSHGALWPGAPPHEGPH